jgi:hypothetical protein
MNKILIYFLLLAGDDAVPDKEESSPPPPSSERQTGREGRKERTGGTGKRTGSEASARTPSSQIRYIQGADDKLEYILMKISEIVYMHII